MAVYTISTDKSKLNLNAIHDFLNNHSYWAKGRSMETVQRSIENSLCFGLYNPEDELVGFARVVTDYAVFGYLMDVYVLEEYRKRGLGKQLMDSIMHHPDLQALQKFMLATNDAQGLYAQYGFKLTENADKIMEIVGIPR